MKKILLILIFCSLYQHPLHAQVSGFFDGNSFFLQEKERIRPPKKASVLSFFFGPSNYLGDLGGNSGVGRPFFYDNNFKKRTYFYGISFTKMYRSALGFRFAYSAGRIAGSDLDAAFKDRLDNAYTRYKRNLDFRTTINEASLLLEFYPLKCIYYRYPLHHIPIQPYLLGGIGLFAFNPQGSYFDPIADDYQWVDLHPLRTEGQGMKEIPFRDPYKLTQWNMPFGAGLQFGITPKTSLSLEFVGRRLFTDYLDDVSTFYVDPALFDQYLSPAQAELAKLMNNKSRFIDPDNPYFPGAKRGNPNYRDFYYSINIKLSIRINKITTPTFLKKQYKFDDSEICD